MATKFLYFDSEFSATGLKAMEADNKQGLQRPIDEYLAIKDEPIHLIYEPWDWGHCSGTIRTTPENYYVATVKHDLSLQFDNLEACTRNVDKAEVLRQWDAGQIETRR